jgi:outer membrane biosynthesis protein TonB
MSADYLWDRSGPPDPEIARLERVLSTLASGRSVGAPPEITPEATAEELVTQPERPRRLAPVLAAAAALLVGLGAGYGLGTSRQPEVSMAADPAPLVPAPLLAPVPAPTPPARSEPASAEPRSRAPASPSARPTTPPVPVPPPARSEVLDPWARTLSSAQVSSVVNRNASEIRSRCWQPALAKRSPSAPDTARLSATLHIAASGSVQSVTVSEAPGHPGFSRCVAQRIRSWRFPSAAQATTVHVPFVFVAPSSNEF